MSSSSSSVSAATKHSYRLPAQPASLSQKLVNKILEIDPAKILGKGVTSVVFRSENPETKSPLAVKLYRSKGLMTKVMQHELDVLLLLKDAPHTLQVRAVLKAGLALRQCKGKTIWQICAEAYKAKKCTFPVAELMVVAKQALEALVYFKSKNVVHGDIQWANCFFDEETSELTIVDFGSAMVLTNKESQKCKGSPDSQSPETVWFKRVGFGNDMWTLAMMLFCIYTEDTFFPRDKAPDNRQFAQQFEGSFLKVLAAQCPGNSEEERSCEAKKEIGKYISEQPEALKYYTIPWRDRIRDAAKRKNEPGKTEQLISFLEKIFVLEADRIKVEDALQLVSGK